MRRACFTMIILVWISSILGCGVMGRSKNFRPFEENTLTQVTPGKTTASEVTQLFGAPSQIVKLANGNAYVYERSLSKGTGLWLVLITFANYDTQYDRIVFFIDKENIVTHYGSTFKMGTAAYEMPF